MIELVLSGGLGNQLFQYACARSIQLRNRDSLIINKNLYKHDKYGRHFSLDAFSIPRNEVEIVDRPIQWVRFLGGVSNLSQDKSYALLRHFGVYIWKGRSYKEIECKKKRNILFGYFQSEKYFDEYSDIIKKELLFSSEMPEENKEWYYVINNSESVCLHIRRADYVKERITTCSLNYYEKAISTIRKTVHNCKFYVFSDDYQWVKNNISMDNMYYVDNCCNRDHQVLRLMCGCKHFIMSNSSFSWWAQFLSNNKDKTVIAPKKWVDDDSLRDIYQSNWVLL